MTDIALSGAMRANLFSLQSTTSLLESTQFKLSTGRKINSALDGAQSFFAAQSLNNRASDLSMLLDAMGQSIQTIKKADTAVSSLSKMLDQASALATEAKDKITTASGQAAATGSQNIENVKDLSALSGIDTNSDELDITVGGTAATAIFDVLTNGESADMLAAKINDDTALSGKVQAGFTAGGALEIKSLEAGSYLRLEGEGGSRTGADGLSLEAFQSLGLGDFVKTETEDTADRVAGTIIAGNKLSSDALASGSDASTSLLDAGFLDAATATDSAFFTLVVDGVEAQISIVETDTVQELIDDINNNTTLNGSVTASFNSDDNTLDLEAAASVTSIEVKLEVDTITGASIDVGFGFGSGATGSVGSAKTLDTAGDVYSEFFTFATASADVTQLQTDYNEVRSQIDNLVEDAGYRGVNLLRGDNLETDFNEDRSNKLTTEGVDFTVAGLGVSTGSFISRTAVESSLTEIRDAKDTVRSFGSSIANDLAVIQTREDFTTLSVNTLKEGADKLTLADPNEESANMLALQTRQQLGFISLSIASSAQQGVLRLF